MPAWVECDVGQAGQQGNSSWLGSQSTLPSPSLNRTFLRASATLISQIQGLPKGNGGTGEKTQTGDP